MSELSTYMWQAIWIAFETCKNKRDVRQITISISADAEFRIIFHESHKLFLKLLKTTVSVSGQV